jgi:hypothetical protein
MSVSTLKFTDEIRQNELANRIMIKTISKKWECFIRKMRLMGISKVCISLQIPFVYVEIVGQE